MAALNYNGVVVNVGPPEEVSIEQLGSQTSGMFLSGMITGGILVSGSDVIASGYSHYTQCENCKQSIGLLSPSVSVYAGISGAFYPGYFCWGCAGVGSRDNPFGRKGDVNFLVAADWLEEHGYQEAAVQLRKVTQ